MAVNKVILVGNIGKDPDVKYSASGTAVANFSLATTEKWKSDGKVQEKTEWHRVVLWNNRSTGLADLAEKYMKKGDRIYVEGRIEYRTWEDRDGNTRYSTEINAREVILLGQRGGAAGSDELARAPAAANESYDDFPEALDEEDDDLPF